MKHRSPYCGDWGKFRDMLSFHIQKNEYGPLLLVAINNEIVGSLDWCQAMEMQAALAFFTTDAGSENSEDAATMTHRATLKFTGLQFEPPVKVR